jgi:prepilin-type N-terminal cleavage/methylation domain-containing protein
MNKKGFTVIELLVGMVIVIIIVVIALPLGGIRAKKQSEKSMKAQLACVKEAEELFKAQHGTYTSDATKLANWKPTTKKYYFSIRDANATRFVVEAKADLNNDKIFDDVWTIDENGVLKKIK